MQGRKQFFFKIIKDQSQNKKEIEKVQRRKRETDEKKVNMKKRKKM